MGQAQEKFISVELEILEQLRAEFTDSYSSIVHFHLYMIGRTAELATPTIMVFCQEKEPRKKAKKALEEGRIIEKLPGFRIGHQSTQPLVGSLIQPATERSAMDQLGLPGSAPRVYFDPSHAIQAFGMPIFVKHSDAILRQATANAVFDGEKCVYLTVSHVFHQNAESVQNTTTDSDSEKDFGSGTEAEVDDVCMEVTSRASMSSAGESLDDGPDSASSESESSTWTNEPSLTQQLVSDNPRASALQMVRATQPMGQGLSDSPAITSIPPIESLEYLGCLTRSSTELDWALVEIKNPKSYARIHEIKSTTWSDNIHTNPQELTLGSRVIANTSHGSIYGILSDDASYMRFPGSFTFQKVYSVALDAPLDWGDCSLFPMSLQLFRMAMLLPPP
ncbi:hypothetical protein N0V83_001334 [Neocucurbitaria cava]|uniref:Uncharacterized protein n=1 Tax=Neocucurbitaria cava TaxID=798079 RepID=A0A9W8YI59_9PLEO|nr:hypothetical protein N0V83_001334 [Neocucurbitaria cava]